jgi:hypothetical protein
MMEKIILAIAIACSLYLNVQFKPQQKPVEIGVGSPLEILREPQPALLLMV